MEICCHAASLKFASAWPAFPALPATSPRWNFQLEFKSVISRGAALTKRAPVQKKKQINPSTQSGVRHLPSPAALQHSADFSALFPMCRRHLISKRTRKILFVVEFVQNRLRQPGDDRFFRAKQVENNEFIFSALEPRTRHVSGLRRSDVPKPPEAMAVYPNNTFSPRTQVQKRISHLINSDRSAPESQARPSRISEMKSSQHLVIQRKIEDLPIA